MPEKWPELLKSSHGAWLWKIQSAGRDCVMCRATCQCLRSGRNRAWAVGLQAHLMTCCGCVLPPIPGALLLFHPVAWLVNCHTNEGLTECLGSALPPSASHWALLNLRPCFSHPCRLVWVAKPGITFLCILFPEKGLSFLFSPAQLGLGTWK